MKHIKTIHRRIDESAQFDNEVNAALEEGWTLTKREFVASYCVLYAELELVTITEEEKCCENCLHCDNTANQPPCDRCIDASHWLPEATL